MMTIKRELLNSQYRSETNITGNPIIDNMLLDDLWQGADQKKKAKYDLANQEFKNYILTLQEYEVSIYDDIGDGIAVLRKNK